MTAVRASFLMTIFIGHAFWSGNSYSNVPQQVKKESIKQVLTYCVDPDWMPYEAIRANKHVGLSADYVRLIEKYSNVDFKLVVTESWNETLQRLQDGSCEAAAMLNRTPERDAYLAFSKPFFNAENVFVTNSSIAYVSGYSSIGDRKLGLVRGYRHEEYVQRYYPELNILLVDTEAKGLLALSAGKVDVLVGSMLSVTSHIQKFGLGDLKISGLAKPHDLLSMGVIKRRSDMLNEINQAIDAISEAEHVELFRQWNQVKVIDEVDYRLFVGLAATFIVLVCLVAWRNHYVVKFNRTLMVKNELLESLQEELLEKNSQLEFLSNRDPLTSLYNRNYMVQRCEQEIAMANRFEQPNCLILFDIDHFKVINDNHGHSIGDEVICTLCELVTEQIREIDVLARWGGEEFLILCPRSTLNEAEILAKRIQTVVAGHHFDIVEHITCSFGLAQYQPKESFVKWFDRTDNAMYQAKKQGRNRVVRES